MGFMKRRKLNGNGWLCLIVLGVLIAGGIGRTQLQQSGGPGSAVTATQAGTWTVQPGNTANTTAWKVDGSAVTQPVSGNVGQSGTWTVQPGNTANTTAWKVDGSAVTQPISGTVTVNALPASTAIIGYIKQRPNGCTSALTSDVVHDTVGVATGAGTSVSAVTGCVLECYVNNITNSAVTLRIADKTGTPIIWVGGGTDFSIPANSNLGCGADGLQISGITMTSGITAIAGTTAALNLHIVTRE
jgi:hypothetical protein